jgi:hypothetical protein
MMRKSLAFLLLPLLLAGCHPSDSFREAFSSGNPPVLDSVTPRVGGMADFHFHATDGNVVVLHRDVLDGAHPRAPLDISLDIDPAQQRAGATFTDHWSCEGATTIIAIRSITRSIAAADFPLLPLVTLWRQPHFKGAVPCFAAFPPFCWPV